MIVKIFPEFWFYSCCSSGTYSNGYSAWVISVTKELSKNFLGVENCSQYINRGIYGVGVGVNVGVIETVGVGVGSDSYL